jgi:uncharacterized protein YndB with AHSA1/START domain
VSEIRSVEEYPYPIEMVWRAVTEPELVSQWTATGRGGTPVGFSPELGNRFRLVGRPVPGWAGIVYCEVLEVRAPLLLRYTWQGAEGEGKTLVTYRLEEHGSATRFTYEHTGFHGLGGFAMSRLLGSVRRKMLRAGLPRVLQTMNEDDTLRRAG